MKRIINLVLIIFVTLSCNAQIISLEQAAACRDNPSTCPDFTYIKDINNSLDMYVGTWKGSYNGKNYEFRFIKKLAVGERIKKDKLIGRLLVTDNSGNVIYTSLNEPDDKTYLWGMSFLSSNLKTYSMSYTINGECNDFGTLFLRSTNIPNQLSLLFWRQQDLVDLSECPNIRTYKTLIPKDTSIILIKQ